MNYIFLRRKLVFRSKVLYNINGKVVNFTPVTETSYTVNNKVFEAYGINQDTIESAGGTVTLTRFQ